MALLEQHRMLVSWLRRYVDGFRKDRRLPPMMQSKWEHSARVARLCRDIARELDWAEEDSSLAEAAGWVHDVGRFSQWAEYGTMTDALSIDHAQRGHDVLVAQSPLKDHHGRGSEALLDAVRCHNMLELPVELAQGSRELSWLVRDADKLDIFEVVQDYLQQGRLGELLPRLEAEGPPSPPLVEEITRRRRGSYSNAKTIADFLLIMMSWVYDLNYAPALRRVRERDVLGRLRAYLPRDGGAASLLAGAESHVAGA